MSLIEIVLSYSLGYMCLLIVVYSSLARVHSLTVVGAMYCAMTLMCVLHGLSPVTVVLLLWGANGTAVIIFPFPPCTYVRCIQCCPPLILMGPEVQ